MNNKAKALLDDPVHFIKLVEKFAVALASRPNSEVVKTNDVAIFAAKDVIEKLKYQLPK
jgi:hypothetical protein